MSDTLYHYTDSAVFTSIVEKRAIRLSARWYLNDPREGIDFLDLIRRHAELHDIAQDRVDTVLAILKSAHAYVSCFSSEGDLLSQWRGYASDGMGVSIGFDHDLFRELLKAQSDALIREVVYIDSLDEVDQASELGRAIETVLTHGTAPKPSVVQSLGKIHWAVKRKAYHEEREFSSSTILRACKPFPSMSEEPRLRGNSLA